MISPAQRRELDTQYARDVLGYRVGAVRIPSHTNPGTDKEIRIFIKDECAHFFQDPSGEFKRVFANLKDDTQGMATPLPPYSADYGLTATTLTSLGFVVWPCLPERDGRDGVMFIQHDTGIIEPDAFHLVSVKGSVYADLASGAVISAIKHVNGILPGPYGDEDEEAEGQEV